MIRLTEKDVARFWSKVDRNGPVHAVLGTPCWLWMGSTLKRGGYGQFSVQPKTTLRVHRVAFFLGGGTLKPGQEVCHRCDVRLCCNYETHLFGGTRQENMRDCAEKARLVLPPVRGEANSRAKLSEADVHEIRRRLSVGERLRPIALDFGMTESGISRIKHGKSWAWL